jgi:hypothetical protein
MQRNIAQRPGDNPPQSEQCRSEQHWPSGSGYCHSELRRLGRKGATVALECLGGEADRKEADAEHAAVVRLAGQHRVRRRILILLPRLRLRLHAPTL